MKRTAIFALAALGAVTMLGGCKSRHEQVDLTGIHTTAVETAPKETLAQSLPETVKETEAETTTAASGKDGGSAGSSASAQSISTKTDSYQTGGILIQYPIISGMADGAKQEKVNQLLKDNSQSFIGLQGVDETKDSLSVACKVISADRRRLTVVYTGTYTQSGAAYPLNLFYTNTVDLEQVKSLGLNDYTDGYTMAGYLLSDDCEFHGVSAELKAELLDYRAGQTIEDYTKLLESADFSTVKSGGEAAFPQSFSYTDQGVLYFSIPVPHALGDYAIVNFNLDGK